MQHLKKKNITGRFPAADWRWENLYLSWIAWFQAIHIHALFLRTLTQLFFFYIIFHFLISFWFFILYLFLFIIIIIIAVCLSFLNSCNGIRKVPSSFVRLFEYLGFLQLTFSHYRFICLLLYFYFLYLILFFSN